MFVIAFRDRDRDERHRDGMSTPNTAVKTTQVTEQAALEDELRQAEADFAHGGFIELTVDDLDRSIAAGEWPWPDESSE